MSTQLTAATFASHWATLINTGDLEGVIALYNENSSLLPTFSPHVVTEAADLRDYFVSLGSREELEVKLHENTVKSAQLSDHSHIIHGIYSFNFRMDEASLSFPSRFTFVIDLSSANPIIHHHSSQVPRVLD